MGTLIQRQRLFPPKMEVKLEHRIKILLWKALVQLKYMINGLHLQYLEEIQKPDMRYWLLWIVKIIKFHSSLVLYFMLYEFFSFLGLVCLNNNNLLFLGLWGVCLRGWHWICWWCIIRDWNKAWSTWTRARKGDKGLKSRVEQCWRCAIKSSWRIIESCIRDEWFTVAKRRWWVKHWLVH